MKENILQPVEHNNERLIKANKKPFQPSFCKLKVDASFYAFLKRRTVRHSILTPTHTQFYCPS